MEADLAENSNFSGLNGADAKAKAEAPHLAETPVFSVELPRYSKQIPQRMEALSLVLAHRRDQVASGKMKETPGNGDAQLP